MARKSIKKTRGSSKKAPSTPISRQAPGAEADNAVVVVPEETAEKLDKSAEVEVVSLSEPLPALEPLIELVEVQEAGHGERHEMVKSATLNMLGNLGSSVMGMVRQVVLSTTGSATAGPFFYA